MKLLNKVIDYINRKNIILAAGIACILFLLFIVIFAPMLEKHNPVEMNLAMASMAPSGEYPFGTDALGRCILCRIIEGSRISLTTAGMVVIISAASGSLIGLFSGFAGGFLDGLFMRIVDVFLAFPSIVFALAIATVLGAGQKNLIIALCCIQWTRYARLVRGEVILLKNEQFMESARSIGNQNGRLMFYYLLPHVISKIFIMMSLDIGGIILYCASLSFLGLGAQPPSPDWGTMISDGKEYLRYAPWISLYPGLAIAFTALSFNMLGDGLRDLLDPRMREKVSEE